LSFETMEVEPPICQRSRKWPARAGASAAEQGRTDSPSGVAGGGGALTSRSPSLQPILETRACTGNASFFFKLFVTRVNQPAHLP